MNIQRAYSEGFASVERVAIVTAEDPEKQIRVVEMMIRELAAGVANDDLAVVDWADRIQEIAVRTGMVKAHGQDRIQAMMTGAIISPLFLAPKKRPEAIEGDPVVEKPATTSTSPRGRPVTFSAPDLMRENFPAINYVVPMYLAEGCTLMAGRPKIGKSWLALDVAMAKAEGGKCLGQPCEPGDVLYLALEDNKRRLQRRIRKLLIAGDPPPSRLLMATDWPRGDAGISAIRAWIAATPGASLVIVDVLAMFRSSRGDNQSLYESDYAALKGLQGLAGDTGVAIVVTHHTRKGAADVDPFDKVSGTLGLSGAADTVVILDRDSGGATLYGRGRDVEEFEKAVIFDTLTCRWSVQGEAVDVRRSDERTVILTALKESNEPMSPSDLAAVTEFPSGNVRQLLFKMTKSGEVQKMQGRARYWHPDRVVIAAPPSSPHNNDNEDNDPDQ
jgi:AAA domain